MKDGDHRFKILAIGAAIGGLTLLLALGWGAVQAPTIPAWAMGSGGPDSWNPADDQTPPDLWRFYELPELAKEAARAGEFGMATELAEEMLALAERYSSNWNYGNAIHDANVVLGLAALARDDRETAIEHLHRAGATPGSPQLDSFGPNMRLAQALAEAGESQAVVAYFELCRAFWEMDRGRLDRWSSEVRNGKVPAFGANLEF